MENLENLLTSSEHEWKQSTGKWMEGRTMENRDGGTRADDMRILELPCRFKPAEPGALAIACQDIPDWYFSYSYSHQTAT